MLSTYVMSDEFLRKIFQFKSILILVPEKIKMRYHVPVVRNAAFVAFIIYLCAYSLDGLLPWLQRFSALCPYQVASRVNSKENEQQYGEAP